MGKKRPELEVDPLFLPVGTRVGPWRVQGWRGRGAYGTLYRVERVGQQAAGSFALKLATHARDERFEREAWLLSRIQSPYVPRLHEQGVWAHPSGAFPYVVMGWVEGESLYEWAERRNPTWRQAARLLAQVARALEATHAVGGLHRDVKGENVLVRPADGRAFLTDFGAGHYRGAATLTTKLLPPGTPAYRSPEARGFLRVFLRHPTAHYPASTCDDLFALGVMAHRLVTDEYPPSTHPEESGSEVWSASGSGPRPPRELNPRVSPALDALILRLLAIAPEERFGGRAGEAAEALELVAESAEAEAAGPLFSWGNGHLPRWRAPESVRRAEALDAAAREQALREEEARSGARAHREQAPPWAWGPVWGVEMAVALLGLLLAGGSGAWLYRGQELAGTASTRAAPRGERVAVADSVIPAATLAPMLSHDMPSVIGLPLPEKPFPGQRTPPCNRHGEVELRGGCWYLLGNAPAPCKEDAYDWKGACYLPSYPPRRPSASQLP
ncbi:serine/threonine-protein kinase [Hyalangium gracile]|uniref:serine/threonine-protein kinase n=1 Tax=Hyalangium gracile TaxID=394092 RepID=UPI001CCDBDED|nr:serine/threonine-protein kinase [Hyalangium gracile]